MPSAALARMILKTQKIEYALCDSACRILEYSPGFLHLTHYVAGPLRGQTLDMLFDELAGSEAELQAIRKGTHPPLVIEKIHRRFPDGHDGYLTLTVMPYSAGLLLIAKDVTKEGELEQRVTQQRNELDLMVGQLAEARAQLDDLLHRFVPGAVADQMIANPKGVRLGGERRTITVLFADLRGFTRWTEDKEPELVLDLLNERLALASDAVVSTGGTLDKYMGDAIMGIFNAPEDDPDHAWDALRAGWQIVQALRDHPILHFSVGVNTGEAVVGNVGTMEAMNYTAIGDAVNQAKRLQEMAKRGQLLIGAGTHALTAARIQATSLGLKSLRGRRNKSEVFEVTGLVGT